MSGFVRDPNDWLRKLSPDEWIQAALGEMRRAEEAYASNNVRGGVAGCKRAAGMSLNAVLILEPNDAWGRTYVEHIAALADDPSAPADVRRACRTVRDAAAPGGSVVPLRTPRAETGVTEAAKDVMAYAYAVVKRHGKTNT